MFKKKLVALLLACTTVFSMVGCSSNESKEEAKESETKKVLRVATAGTYKPWCYQEGEEMKGVDAEILAEAAKRMGDYEVEYTVASFDGLFGLLDSGKVDTIACQVSVTPEREEKYQFSEIYAYNPMKLVVREDEKEINSLEDLKGRKMLAVPSTYESEFLQKYKEENDPNNEIDLTIMEGRGAEAIVQEKGDSYIYTQLVFDDMKKESGLPIKMVGDVLYEEVNAYPFLKDADEEFVNKFNEAIKSMQEDGFMTELYNKYFGMDISKSLMKK